MHSLHAALKCLICEQCYKYYLYVHNLGEGLTVSQLSLLSIPRISLVFSVAILYIHIFESIPQDIIHLLSCENLTAVTRALCLIKLLTSWKRTGEMKDRFSILVKIIYTNILITMWNN